MYTLSQISEIVGGQLIVQNENSHVIVDLAYDSRKTQGKDDVLFFAIKTHKNDGHKYIGDVYEKGIVNFIVRQDFKGKIKDYPKANFVIVKDTLSALQSLAKYHRQKFKLPVIGIAGSNGKTTVKEWLYQLLCPDKKIAYSPNSFNSQIGVPLSIWKISEDDKLGIFEAGISQPNEMGSLAEIIQPTIGIFTNIGAAHDESFIDIRQKAGEKLNLFCNVETLIYNSDQSVITEALLRSGLTKKIHLFCWSFRKKDANLWIKEVKKAQNQTIIKGIYKAKTISVSIPFSDDAAIENTIHCWACMLLLGYDNELIYNRLSLLTPIAMRLEFKDGINRCMIINDTYNSDINSLQIALDLMNNQQQFSKKTVILSDILQSRQMESELYEKVNYLLESKNVHKIIGIGKAISRQSMVFSMQKEFFETTDDFLVNFITHTLENEIVLVKGSRPFHLERIADFLELKTHETVLEIHLPHLVSNFNYYRSLLAPSVKTMAMVKAFAYGAGDIDIANALQYHGVDYLAVAYADEGIALREKNITVPIMVMNPEENSFDAILRYNLQPEIYSQRVLNQLLKRMDIYPQINSVHIHIKIDTGMHRLGFSEGELPDLLHIIKEHSGLVVESVFSHFAAADDPQSDDFSALQVTALNKAYDYICNELNYKPLRHICNTVGICRFPNYHFDMVRMGIGLYGINSFADSHKISNVATLKTIISQIKTISKGQTVGYNRTWTAQRDTVLGIIPIGYADGFPRSASNIAHVLVNQQLAPVIGNVCMDMCMIDLTQLSAKEGDTVLIFGTEHPLPALAKSSQMIEYELLTGISQRVKRIYVED
ncbi:MAG: bifunctional UDP-N-acetylmuramoyl-tripeptide:D-alanyl-D-alanine ligase/alanine racemase [Bacteroidales bacterium]|jgi:alanine racemase|nr:bifunctional UDP-N-acetylmuramoyl-tripeptide:D-alanyl-D-alanine ligase/alanine racemase [Bacteroidales bacterium]